MRNWPALIAWVLITAAGLAGFAVISWRMAEWHVHGFSLLVGIWALLMEVIAAGYGIRMTRRTWSPGRGERQ